MHLIFVMVFARQRLQPAKAYQPLHPVLGSAPHRLVVGPDRFLGLALLPLGTVLLIFTIPMRWPVLVIIFTIWLILKINLLDIMPFLPSRLEDNRALGSEAPIYVDNEKLEGFLDYFQSSKCRTDCYKCEYCQEVAKNTITITNKERLERLIDSLTERVASAVNWAETAS